MGELAPEFKQKIANFDGHADIDSDEKAVIFYVESWARNMPPEYLDKLIDAIKEKLKDKQLSKDQIRVECESAVKALNHEIQEEKKQKKAANRTIWEKFSSFIDQNVFSQIYRRTEGLEREKQVDEQIRNSKVPMIKKISVDPELKMVIYQAIEVEAFEKEIKKTSPKEINSNALANYFLHLHSKKQLTSEVLIEKFWWDVLLELGGLWTKWWNDPIAYNTLRKNGLWYIIDIITELSSSKNMFDRIKNINKPEEVDVVILLLQEKENKLKTEFKNELKAGLISKGGKEPEITEKVEKFLQDLLKCKGKDWVVQASRIIAQYDKENNTRTDEKKIISSSLQIQSTTNQRVRAENKRDQLRTTDPTQLERLKKKEIAIKREEEERKEADLVNNALTTRQRVDLVSWKKGIDQVIEEIKKEDKEFAKEYKTWQKEKEKFDQENPIKRTTGKEREIVETQESKWVRGIPFNKIDSGKPHTFSLDRQSENTDTVTIKRHENLYVIQMGNDPENTTELPKEKVSAYIQSLRFMEKLGLGYFLRNLPQNELSGILALASKDTETVDNRDGNFDETEKKRILSSFGKILGVGGVDNINSKDGQKLFQRFFFTHPSIETILASKDIIRNGSLDSEILKKSLKTA